MTVTDVEISRALNALITTLNDQRPAGADPGRWQAIVTGALGGQPNLVVHRDSSDPPAGTLRDAGGAVVARFRRSGDRWTGERA